MKSILNRDGKSTELVRKTFFGSVLVIIGAILFFLPRLTIPIGLAYILYLIINPIVPAMGKLRIKRGTASLLLVITSLFCIIYPVVKVTPSIVNEVEKVQYYVPKIEKYLKTNYHDFQVQLKDKTGFEVGDKFLTDALRTAGMGTKNLILNLPNVVGAVVEWLFLVPFFLFFFLRDNYAIREGMLKIVPNSMFEKYYFLTYQFNKKLGDYIFAKFVEASIIGTIITSGLIIMDVRFSLLLGVIAAVTNIIPYVGPFLGIVPAVVLGLVEYGGSSPTFGAIMILYIVANAVDLAIIFPILMSKLVDLHPIIVVVSVILGSQFLGVAGMIISIPLAAAFKLILQEIYDDIFGPRRRS